MPKKITKNEMRVAIAQDVIERLDSGLLKVGLGAYFNKGPGPLPTTLSETEKQCRVCALGAAMMSAVRLYNKYDPALLYETHAGGQCQDLNRWFSQKQIALIEAAFEGSSAPSARRLYTKGIRRAIKFGQDYRYSTDLLRAIMQNIIDHNGTFKPEVRYDVV